MSETGIDAGGDAADTDQKALRGRRNWLRVARKNVADAGRAWQLYALTGAFVAVLTLASLEEVQRSSRPLEGGVEVPFRNGLHTLTRFIDLLLPLVVLIGVYMTIARERERGSLRVLLALPVSRRDAVVGTALGQAVVVAVTLVVALTVNAVTMWVLYDSMDPLMYAKFAVAVVAFGMVFVGIAVGIAALSRTTNRVIGASIGIFLVVTFLWNKLLRIVDLATGVQPQLHPLDQNVAPAWRVFLYRIRPGEAWQLVTTDWLVPVMSERTGGENTYYATHTTPGPEPFYLDSWFLVIVLIGWCVLPLLVGYWRFRAADLG